jgi:hypothetical protein
LWKIQEDQKSILNNYNTNNEGIREVKSSDLYKLFPIQQSFNLFDYFHLTDKQVANKNINTSLRKEHVNISVQEKITSIKNSKNTYLMEKNHNKDFKILKENSFINRETLRNKIFTKYQINKLEEYFTHDLFSTKKITPTCKYLKINKIQISDLPCESKKCINESELRENEIHKLVHFNNQFEFEECCSSNRLANYSFKNKTLPDFLNQKCLEEKLLACDLKSLSESMSEKFVNRRLKILNNKHVFIQKDKITIEKQNIRNVNKKYLIINVVNFILNRSSKSIEKIKKKDLLEEQSINITFSKGDFKKKKTFKNDVNFDVLSFSNNEDVLNNFSLICDPSYIQKNLDLKVNKKMLKVENEKLDNEISKIEELIKNTNESYQV